VKTFPKSTEQIQDIVAALLVEGTGVTLAYNDGAGTLTISSSVDLTGYATTAYVDDEVSANGVSLQAYASNASNLASGTVPDARLSSNVARRDQANTFSGNQTLPSNGTGYLVSGGEILVGRDATGIYLAGGLATYNGRIFVGNTTTPVRIVGAIVELNQDVQVRRNATGPTFETRAAGGLKVCIADGSALAAVVCSNITVGDNFGSSGKVTTGVGLDWGVGFGNRGTLGAFADGIFGFRTLATTAGFLIDCTTDGTAKLRNRSNTADGSLNLANLTASGVFTTDFGGGVDLQTQAANHRIGHRVSGTFRTGFDYYHLNVHSSYLVRWSNSGSNITTMDTTLSRASAGVLQVGNAPGVNALGSLLLANLTASGTVQGTFLPTQYTVASIQVQ